MMSNLIQATAARRPIVVNSGTGYGVEFNVAAQPQFLEAPVPAGLAGATAYCFAMYVKRRASLGVHADFPTLFGLTVEGGSTTTGIGITRSNTGAEGVTITGSGDKVADTNLTTADLPLDEWVHVAGIRPATGGGRMVVNGALVDSMTSGISEIPNDLAGFRVTAGAARTTGARPVSIEASNLQIWNVALTDQEVQDWCMKRLTGTLPAGLIFYAPL